MLGTERALKKTRMKRRYEVKACATDMQFNLKSQFTHLLANATHFISAAPALAATSLLPQGLRGSLLQDSMKIQKIDFFVGYEEMTTLIQY